MPRRVRKAGNRTLCIIIIIICLLISYCCFIMIGNCYHFLLSFALYSILFIFFCESNHGPGGKQRQPTTSFMTNVTCGLTAKKQGSALCPMLIAKYGTSLLYLRTIRFDCLVLRLLTAHYHTIITIRGVFKPREC